MSEPVDPDELRVGTDEREAAIGALGEHFAKGRLEIDEYEERAGAAAGDAGRVAGPLR